MQSTQDRGAMLKILHANYAIIRQIIPHPVWFAELTGMNERVAENVLRGGRTVSIRHLVTIARAFGLEDERLQFPILGRLDPDEPMNEARRAWLCANIGRYGTAKRAGTEHPGLGWKTINRLLEPGQIVSPIMCELIARHTGWALPDQVLHPSVTPREPEPQHAETLLRLVRLERQRPVDSEGLPGRTTLVSVWVEPRIRFCSGDYASLHDCIQQDALDLSLPLHYRWLRRRIQEAYQSAALSLRQARILRRLMREARERRLFAGHAVRVA